MKTKKAFTIVELLLVVAIIVILLTSIYMAISNSRKNARVNSAKTTLKSLMITLVSCSISGSAPIPVNIGEVGQEVCVGVPDAKWPSLPSGYAWNVSTGNFGYACNFEVLTSDTSTGKLTCNCISQRCVE